MRCPKCKSQKTEVYNSRKIDKLNGSTWRRRNCKKCNTSFTTYEIYIEKIESIIRNERTLRKQTDAAREFLEKLEGIINECGDESNLPSIYSNDSRNCL